MWETTLPAEQNAILRNLQIGNGILFVKHHNEMTEIIEYAADKNNRNIVTIQVGRCMNSVVASF